MNYLFFGATSDCAIASLDILKNRGDKVFLIARDKNSLEYLSQKYQFPYLCLASFNLEEIDTAFQHVLDQFDQIHGVVNFCGSILLKPIHLCNQTDFSNVINDNLLTSLYIARACAKHLLDSGGVVIFFSSAASRIGITNHDLIGAAKAAIEGLVKSASATYASSSLRFNCIAPGLIETKLTKSIMNNEKAKEVSLRMHPIHRLGNINDIANAVAFLLDEKNSFITGETLVIDGGLSSLKTLN